MANDEHLRILRQGTDAWNQWRNDNSAIIPSLRRANLKDADLSYAQLWDADLNDADLKGANLRGANLRGANLSDANLSDANLRGANLRGANLSFAKLWDADLRDADLSRANLRMSYLNNADLSKANLSEAVLWNAHLRDAKLWQADLSKANLDYADLWKADLSEADLSEAHLKKAQLSFAQLWRANLNDANLSGLDLSGLDLSEFDLSGVDLRNANLSRVQVLGTDFRGAKFTGACLEDWNINFATKLNDIECQYVYLKNNKQERRPSSGEFRPGEFTKLFQKALDTVDLIFTDGIDWKAFFLSFQELQAEYGKENLSVQAIEKKSGGAFVIRLEVPPEANKADIEFREKELYQRHILLIEAQLNDKENLLNDYKKIVDDIRKDNTDFKDLIKTLAENRPTININMEAIAESNSMSEASQSKYDQRNSNNQFVDTAQPGSKPTFNQYNYTREQRQNLAEAAAEIQQLLNQLAKTNPTTDAVTETVHQEIKRNPTLRARLLAALKAGGLEALKVIFDHPAFSIPAETIKGYLEAK